MYCPFRIRKIIDSSYPKIVVKHTEYENCYEDDCPYYGNLGFANYCKRAEKAFYLAQDASCLETLEDLIGGKE